MTHTPGPWKDAFRSSMMYGERYWVFSTVTKKPVAMVHLTESSQEATDIHKANARLLSAAPALLEALEDLIDFENNALIDDHVPSELIKKAKHAITQAESK